jgi:hypothetical protein
MRRSRKTRRWACPWWGLRAQLAPDTPVEVWFQDEMRVLTGSWRRGERPALSAVQNGGWARQKVVPRRLDRCRN